MQYAGAPANAGAPDTAQTSPRLYYSLEIR